MNRLHVHVGVGWKTFLITGEITSFGEDRIDVADLETERTAGKNPTAVARLIPVKQVEL